MKSYIILTVVALCLIGVTSAIAQPAGDVLFTVTVATTPLTVTAGAVTIAAGLVAGNQQTITPAGDGTALEQAGSNPVAANLDVTMDPTNVLGDPGAAVLISFALPSRLYPSGGAGSGSVACTYGGTSACYLDAAGNIVYFDPRIPIKAFLDPGAGDINVYLGGNFTVAPNSTPDDYLGDAIVTATYVANE